MPFLLAFSGQVELRCALPMKAFAVKSLLGFCGWRARMCVFVYDTCIFSWFSHMLFFCLVRFYCILSIHNIHSLFLQYLCIYSRISRNSFAPVFFSLCYYTYERNNCICECPCVYLATNIANLNQWISGIHFALRCELRYDTIMFFFYPAATLYTCSVGCPKF